MKNLSAFPRFPLSEALIILITLVVCLAGFTKAEVDQNYRKEDLNQQKNENSLLKEVSFMENPAYTHQASEMRSHELRGKNFVNLENFPESPLDRPIKRLSDYFGESEESDSEKESDGYGYDDDEYYHFNHKRNEELNRKAQNDKLAKESENEPKEKNLNMINTDKGNPICKAMKNNEDYQTIEMLNFKESHPLLQGNSENPQNVKPYSETSVPQKAPSTNPLSSLSGIDFKENSAIDENIKDRKEESVLTTSDSKIAEAKKGIKGNEDKESVKLKDAKLAEDSEKKEKEAALKDGKDSVAAKTLKDSSKTSEDKEKTVKLSDNAKLEENIEKISSKSKDSENTKLTKEEKDVARFTDKINSDVFNSNGLSQITSGASFVSNDYKDNLDALKSLGGQGDKKNAKENQEIEKNVELSKYQEEEKESQEKFKEKQLNVMKNDRNRNYDLSGQANLMKMLQGSGKSSPYSRDQSNYEIQNNFFRRREPWRDGEKMSTKLSQDFQVAQQPTQQQQMQQFQKFQQMQLQQQQQQLRQKQQPQSDLSLDSQIKHPFTNLPPNELENTDYHKNFLKSLKKYKGQNDISKIPTSDSGTYITSETTNHRADYVNKKKKRSKPKKRRSMLPEKNLEKEEKFENKHLNQRRNTYSADDSLSDPIQQCLKKPHNSQSLHAIKTNKEETKLLDGKKYFDQWDGNRQKRKSPQKVEYEIKVFNQNQADAKNAKFSHLTSNRLKKDLKTKLSNEDKYLKKYPYSQVSRDDLTKISDLGELESEKKFKRKTPVWERNDQKSVIQTRAVPSGYYSNRVKFGQKSYAKNNEKVTPDSPSEETNQLSQTYFSQAPSESGKNSLQRAWEVKWPNYKHEPTKRFDENKYLNMCNQGNSLLLVKKGERMAKVFQEGNPPKQSNENELTPDQLAKILSEERNYFVFKKTDKDEDLKNSETEPSSVNSNEFGKPSYTEKKFNFLEPPSSGIFNNNNRRQIALKGLSVRSSHSEKNDKKFTSGFHSIGTKSNLKKTFEKFRDLAGFFKDTDQESTDNQYSAQEAKEGQDIVFSQDKLPDPIVINNDDSSKSSGFKQEPVNSIFSISNNFKNLDQQNKRIDFPSKDEVSRNFLTSEGKTDNIESSWKPALKQAFPEAKSIDSVSKNGNEIIVLDLNSNQLKLDHEQNPLKVLPKGQSQSRGSIRSPPRSSLSTPANYLSYEKQNVMLNDIPLVFQFTSGAATDKSKYENKMNLLSNDRAVAIIRSADNQIQIPGSLGELAELPDLLKKFMNRIPLEVKSSVKLIKKKSLDKRSQNEVPQNYNEFHKDFGKVSEIKKKKEISVPQTSFSELSAYNDANIKSLGNILQSLLNPVSSIPVNFEGLPLKSNKNFYRSEKLDQQYQNLADYQPDFSLKSQGRWSPAQEKDKDFIPFSQENSENGPSAGEEINNILRLDGGRLSEKSNENELWKELAAASEKIHRLRREGMEVEKLRKTIEDTLSFKKTRDASKSKEFSDLKGRDKNQKYNSESVALESNDKSSTAEERENEKNLEEEARGGLELEKSSKSDYENHLSELFENLNVNKNQKNSNENTWNKKKRKDTIRQKRFTKRDVSNKVSKTEVQNTVLKSLAEDNYRSVYSPGIKRRLLSTNNEVEDADSYSNEHEHDNNLNSQETQEMCVKNGVKKSIDPVIEKLFLADDNEAEKNRARRSLTSGFHSNFKREIDLDESMPNDFQNFLVTSLGGFGSQKREVVKKGEALWEGKEMSQDNYNQIVENGKDANEDSALEKREVSSSENQKTQTFKGPIYFKNGNQEANLADVTSIGSAEKKVRSDDTTPIKLKPSKFADEKFPTQIRIQITNASSKEKKSSKPIMDENETTSTEMENLPKEKEFFDKNKLNPLHSRNYQKLRHHPGATYSDNEFEEIVSKNLGIRRKPFHSHLWRERKKKKCTAENPMKSVQNFNAFDQKAMESLLRRYKLNQDSDQTAQKISMINRLPQVETVYNPTQGGNKAQIENSKLVKTNNVKSKNALSTQSNLQSNEGLSYDEGFLKPYFKVEEIKSDKGIMKEYEEPDWKTYNGRINLEQEPYGANSPASKTHSGESASLMGSDSSSLYLDYYHQTPSAQKWTQTPSSNYFYHTPSSGTQNPQGLYDVMKFKQQMKNRNGMEKENLDLKPFSKPIYAVDNEGQENLQKNKNSLPPSVSSSPNWLDGASNNLDYSLSKRPCSEYPENKNYDSSGLKNHNPRDFGFFKHSYSTDGTYTKNLFEKPSGLDASQTVSVDNSKDTDYIDSLEDEYPDAETAKESQTDEGLYKDSLKRRNKVIAPAYRRLYNYKNLKNNYKKSEVDENLNDDEEEFDEEYEENGDEEDLEDYTQLGFKKDVEPEMKKFSRVTPKLRGSFHNDAGNSYYNYYYPELKGNSFEQTKFSSSPESKSDLAPAEPLKETKTDADLISESNDLLKRANEKANIFGKNLLKKLHGPTHEEISNRLDKFHNERTSEDMYPAIGNKLSKRKLHPQGNLKRNHENPQIGNRIFYAAKLEVSDDKVLDPATKRLLGNKRNSRRTYYRLPEKNPFYAEFAGEGNNFDCELEENGVHLNENLVNLEKDDFLQYNKNLSGFNEKNTLNSEDFDNAEDVEENLEEGAEDNILENIIGKYIMRKRIKSSTDLNKASEEPIKLKGIDKNSSGDSVKHYLKKRSIEKQGFSERAPKVLKKRLSSGHLTENNFRKYHKKNLTKKRHISDLVSTPYTITALIDNGKNNIRKEEAKDQIKRSALDIFRKITSKEKDNKKVENAEGRSAGFEPLLSFSDKSKGFIKDSKDPVQLQEKQPCHFSEVKNNPPELKAHYPNEGQRLRAQLTEKKKGKAKEVESDRLGVAAQGPWKVELNDKYDRPDANKEKVPQTFKDTENTLYNNQNRRYEAFLVISKNAKDAEQNSKTNFPSISGSFHREVGNSYRTKSDKCRRISINHVRKRSLESSINRMKANDENASQTPGYRAMKESDTENDVTKQEKNRALHDTKSLPEGDSKYQASHVVQRNTKKHRSFVTSDEDTRNSQFFSKGRLINRKSVFPPSSDANIIRVSRHINEETSEYHSQRIVDAILSQVSGNSKFKELIAPGLAMRTPAFKEGIDSKNKAATEMNFSEELQSFLQKFMFDLENLAEQHVKKRMCHKIGKDLKHFLQSQLSTPVGNDKDDSKTDTLKEKCSLLHHLMNTPERKNLSQISQNFYKPSQNVLNDLEKANLLKKLIDNYQDLSEVKKEALGTDHPYLKQELETDKNNTESSENKSCFNQNSENSEISNPTNSNSGLNDENARSENQTSDYEQVTKKHDLNLNSSADMESTDASPKKELPIFFFSEIKNPNQEGIKTASHSVFENIVTVNCTDTSNNNSNEVERQSSSKDSKEKSLTLESSSSQSSKKQTDCSHKESESARSEEALNERKDCKKNTDCKDFLHFPHTQPQELHKHSLGDAAGLQLALKNQDHWVSNLENSKALRNFPSLVESKKISSQEKGGNHLLEKLTDSALDVPSVEEDFRNPRNLVAFYNENSGFTDSDIRNKYIRCRPKAPIFFYSTQKKIITHKSRPFDNVNKRILIPNDCHKCQPQHVLFNMPSPVRHTYVRSNVLAQPYNQRKQYRESNFLKRKIWKRRKSGVPRFLTRYSIRLKEADKNYDKRLKTYKV